VNSGSCNTDPRRTHGAARHRPDTTHLIPPPEKLREEFDDEVRATGRNRSDVLIEAMHDWLKKRRRERPAGSEEKTG
jgi:hypothetical protein